MKKVTLKDKVLSYWGQTKKFLRSALIIVLCITLTGCNTILGDGEVNIVTAPPIVTPKVVVYDNYGEGEVSRFDIGGTDAFYLLPGIENYPDFLQDFSCLDYTEDGYFVYYYCAPAYISAEEVQNYKGTEGTAPTDPYEVFDRDNLSPVCDALIVMAYNPETRNYHVMDAKPFYRETADSMTDGEANTGIAFYHSQNYNFFALSHAYGCKISGKHKYFVFDQTGTATIYDDNFKAVSEQIVAGTVLGKVGEFENQLKIDYSGKKISDIVSDLNGEGNVSDDKDEMNDAMKELSEATGDDFDSGDGPVEELSLNCLIKSAVIDGSDIMYFTLMLYTGESPWSSEILFNRVVSLYSLDLSGDYIKFISKNSNYVNQVQLLKNPDFTGTMDDIKSGNMGNIPDNFSAFTSDSPTFNAFIGGYATLDAEEGRGYRGIAQGILTDKNLSNLALAAYVWGYQDDIFDHESFWDSFGDSIGIYYGYHSAVYLPWAIRRWIDDFLDSKETYMNSYGFGKDEFDTLFYFFTICGVYEYISLYHAVVSILEDDYTLFFGDDGLPPKKLRNGIKHKEELDKLNEEWKNFSSKLKSALKDGIVNYFSLAAFNFTKDHHKYDFETFQKFIYDYGLVPLPGRYIPEEKYNSMLFSNEPGGTRPNALMLMHGTANTYSDASAIPHCSMINTPDEQEAYVIPYTWNEEIVVTDVMYVPNAEDANRIVNTFCQLSGMSVDDFTALGYDRIERTDADGNVTYDLIPAPAAVVYQRVNDVVSNYNNQVAQSGSTSSTDYVDVEAVYHALYGEALENVVNETKSVPAHTFPTSYRIMFPEGTFATFVEMSETEGSATSSTPEGAVLFYDEMNEEGGYYSNITWKREDLSEFSDHKIEGAAIDTGSITYRANTKQNQLVLLLITDKGVKFYPSSDAMENSNLPVIWWNPFASGEKESLGALDINDAFFLTNEELLSSTGFTPYTESPNQAAVSTRLENEVPEERYKDNNKVEATENDVALSLNSARVGTLQSASSFTVLNTFEILLSAYDTGLSLLRMDANHTVMHLQNGSYYQSFPMQEWGKYKVVGYDTEDYMYGAMDLARAKVYEFNYNQRKDEIYLSAMKEYLDQMAIDYVRRRYRTKTTFEEDADGNIINKTVEIVPFGDELMTDGDSDSQEAKNKRLDYEEAVSEKKLFEETDEEAIAELKRIQDNRGIAENDSTKDYLLSLRQKVKEQNEALNEVFMVTRTNNSIRNMDEIPYWVGLKERLQNTTEIGDFKDILAEIRTSDEMIATYPEEMQETYRQLKQKLNYVEDDKRQNESLADVTLDAATLNKMLDEKKTIDDYKEQYDEVTRGKEKEVDPLEEALNTEGILKDNPKDPNADRMEARRLVLEDLENSYLDIYPVEPEKVYAPDGTYVTQVSKQKEDEAWEQYLVDMLEKINPNNLSVKRQEGVDQFASLSYLASRTMENGSITDTPLTVSEMVQDKMRETITTGLDECETVMDVELLFFGTQIKNLGNPYASYINSFNEFESKEYETDSEKSKIMRSSDWYINLKDILLSTDEVDEILTSADMTWEEYIRSVVTKQSGKVLKDEQTGQTVQGYTTAATTFAQLVEFMCEGAGEVDQETKIDLVEDMLIGMESISGYRTIEEAVMIERMNLPAFEKYKGEYESFCEKYNNAEETAATTGGVTFKESSSDSERRANLVEQDFYKKLIVTMQESELVQSYLKENKQTWEQYMASLATLANDPEITDAATSARKVYETFKPYTPISEEDRPKASDGTEERPVAIEENKTAEETGETPTEGGN